MTREFPVEAGVVPSWPGMSEVAQLVASFLARVRVAGDVEAAHELLAPSVRCHQMTSESLETIRRTPSEYAAHVQEMLVDFGRFAFTVTEFLVDGDRAYVRWRQDGHHRRSGDGSEGTGLPLTEVGSAVYRVESGKITEYWVQLDRLGMQLQLDGLTSPPARAAAQERPTSVARIRNVEDRT